MSQWQKGSSVNNPVFESDTPEPCKDQNGQHTASVQHMAVDVEELQHDEELTQVAIHVILILAFFVLSSQTLMVKLGRYDRYLQAFRLMYGTWLIELLLLAASKAFYLVPLQVLVLQDTSHVSAWRVPGYLVVRLIAFRSGRQQDRGVGNTAHRPVPVLGRGCVLRLPGGQAAATVIPSRRAASQLPDAPGSCGHLTCQKLCPSRCLQDAARTCCLPAHGVLKAFDPKWYDPDAVMHMRPGT
ncbi:hypothetical protein QJQ45_017262 [Haematococcus lacustris]|nr:hypothetical protein QJQ45_017262 [Haematococcus lacustris]